MKLHHVVESQQFTVPLLMELFDRARRMEKVAARGGTLDYQGRIMASLFYQPSTRTRFSFEAAMYRLGGRVLSTEQAGFFSSEVEGEQVEDTIRILGGYSDVIVIRHTQAGGAKRAADSLAGARHQRGRRQRRAAPDAGAARSLHDLPRAADRGPQHRVHRRAGSRADGALARVPAQQVRAGEDLLRQPARDADEGRHPRAPRRARRVVRARTGGGKGPPRGGCRLPDAHPARADGRSPRTRRLHDRRARCCRP